MFTLTFSSKHYRDAAITKEDIFHYVYAVFHNPDYKEKYKDELRRERPAIPFYKDFKEWEKIMVIESGFLPGKAEPEGLRGSITYKWI
jgi:predicted helicase